MDNEFKIVYTQNALDDLQALVDHISIGSFQAAYRMRQRIINRASTLQLFPKIGKSTETLDCFLEPGLRYIAEGKYYILYKVIGKEIVISRIIHSARDISSLLMDYDFRNFNETEEFEENDF